MKVSLLLFLLLAGALAACVPSPEAVASAVQQTLEARPPRQQLAEKSVVITVPVTVEVTRKVESEREVAVTRRVEVAVTRVQAVVVTTTALPTPLFTETLPAVATAVPAATAAPAATVVPPLFAETQLQEFDPDTFMGFLGQVRDSFRSAEAELLPIYAAPGPYPANCGAYNGWYVLWVTQAPLFIHVPAEWSALHFEYRSLLQQVVSVTWELHLYCTGGDVAPTPEMAAAAQEFINWAYPRSEAMIVEAQQIPRP